MTYEEIVEQDLQFITQSLSMNKRVETIDFKDGIVQFKWTWVWGDEINHQPTDLFDFPGYSIVSQTMAYGVYKVVRYDDKPYVPDKMQADYNLKSIHNAVERIRNSGDPVKWDLEGIYTGGIRNGVINTNKISAGSIKADKIRSGITISDMVWYDKETGLLRTDHSIKAS